ncbi:MAG: hypothetical protein PHI35_07760 [Victivallaceae bacterium]|nr:hypothetical protein [Victivallaceae bacterium]
MLLTIGSFLFFTALVGLVTWLIVRSEDVKSKDGFFWPAAASPSLSSPDRCC